MEVPAVFRVVVRISDAMDKALIRMDKAVSRGSLYMIGYKGLVENLRRDIERVSFEKDWVSRKAREERDDGKTINDSVLNWQKEVEEILQSAKEFLEKNKNRNSWKCFPRPVSRFKQGKKAVRMAKRVAQLIDSGNDVMSDEIAYLPRVENFPKTDSSFRYDVMSDEIAYLPYDVMSDEIAYLPRVENFPKTDTSFQYFESRKDAYEQIWSALLTESSSPILLGIYGMAGVGKTRLVEQIEEEAREVKFFDTVARADVGREKLDVIHLQDQIAEYLNCHFESQDNVFHRASQLNSSIMNAGRILIILDNVWSVIPLDIIGIPFGNNPNFGSCKILLTSQEEEVCLQNNCEHPIQITPLTIDEGWDLFKNIVGTCQIDSLRDDSLAKEVCNECVGLPLLIHVVGKALESMSHNDWKDTLYQLKNCQVKNLSETGSEDSMLF